MRSIHFWLSRTVKRALGALRYGVFNVATDQGTENDVSDSPFIFPLFSDNLDPMSAAAFTCPRSLFIAGHLHILYNALESSVTSWEFYDSYIVNLRAVQDVLLDTPMRRKLQAVCMQGHPLQSLLDHYSVVHIGWRCEFFGQSSESLGANPCRAPRSLGRRQHAKR